MARKKKGIPIHGWLIIDKPLEISSNNVVGKVRWLTKAQKVGHGGTLDPLATGILPLAFGEATKTVSYAMDGAKTYRFEVTWGESRTTDDGEGEVNATSDHRPSRENIEAILPSFLGEIEQIPPKYSAIKINGQRAYKLARADEEVEMAARTVQIDRLELVECVDANRAVFEVDCGKGTYVRSLGRDIALKLGTVGYISVLRRTKVGPFDETGAISLDSVEEIVHSDALFESLLPIETVLDDILALALSEEETLKIRNGMSLKKDQPDAETMRLMFVGKVVALAKVEDGIVQPFRVFNY
ncbi:tRNA pseudouridine synthase B [Candidatus Terasakiella magnetica]|uniref:tRNA pseudouridine synthase B n=1 Tax=Candidatus Terasakiella magnetica TaxID=1867952 RepID=A0A1C3REE6_9PROT|nr:tRNA pseudouridine(55) synthase TruB [Candidatus Terasakiella magnetica]SCA55611.1 tRNA pseudouridine synthase B [Candidatus Terasakiella magnetica]